MQIMRSAAGRPFRALLAALPLAAITPGVAAATPDPRPDVEITRSSLAAADFGEARLRGTEHRLAIRGAVLPAGEGEFRWALDYAYQRYEYHGLPSRNRDLHRLELPLSWHGDAAYSWMAELRPVIASSSNVFKELWSRGSSDDFLLHGRAIVQRLPGGTGRGIEGGGEIAPAGARWRVVSDERDGASFDYRVRAWRAGAVLRWHSDAGLVLTTRLGLEYERRHRFEDDTGATVNRGVDEARYFELAAGYYW